MNIGWKHTNTPDTDTSDTNTPDRWAEAIIFLV